MHMCSRIWRLLHARQPPLPYAFGKGPAARIMKVDSSVTIFSLAVSLVPIPNTRGGSIVRAGHAYGFVSGLLTLSSLVVAASVCCGPTAAVGRAAWGPTRAIYYVASGMQPVIRVDPLTGNRIVAATPISGPLCMAM